MAKKNFHLICLLLCVCTFTQLHAQDEQTDSVKHDPAEYLSNTLPVLYINTVDETPIVDKENYIEGSYYLDANGCGDYSSVGSVEEPLALQIKGRGNTSWTRPKKPYRLKLDKKAALLGMPKSKHWVLLAAYGDGLAHGRDYLSFKISEKMGMPFTPGCIPIEVVLNGDYIGMYFLSQHIRVDTDRVNITEQDNGETDPQAITGGWLLEIDNYVEENQIRLIDQTVNNSALRVTYHSPDSLSQEQLTYLTDLVHNVHNSVCNIDRTSTEWEQYIDIDSLARYYVIQEAIDNVYAFSGSSWFYKDRGEDTKLIWGPLWDNSSALTNRNDYPEQIDYLYNISVRNHWIAQIAQFPNFQKAIRPWWKKYRDEIFPTMQAEVDAYEQLVSGALASDYLRWGDSGSHNPHKKLERFMRLLTNKYNFLCSRWNDPEEATTLAEVETNGFVGTEYLINDNLAVMGATRNGNRVFVTDGQDHWMQILAGEYYDQTAVNGTIVNLKGIYTGKDFIPTLLLTDAPEINDEILAITPESYDLNTDFNPIVNEVISINGVYNASTSTMQATNAGDEGSIEVTLDTSWIPNWSVVDGKTCTIEGVAQIKEPWPTTGMMLNSFEYPYQNFIVYPLAITNNATVITNIEDSIDGNTIIDVVNMQGQIIKQGVKRSEATQGLSPGIYLIGNKKVVIMR